MKKLILLLLCLSGGITAQTLPGGYNKKLKNASVTVVGDTLIASTGKIERKWCWNETGLKTISIKDLLLNREWGKERPEVTCDWNLPGAINPNSQATFVSLEARKSDDEGFINPHLELITHLRYDSARLEVQHVVWVFPDTPGIRTQLRVKAMDGFNPEGLPEKETTRNYYGHTLSVPSGQTE